MAALRVDWDTVFRTGEEELLTAGEEAVDGLYAFLLSSSVTGITDHLKTPDSLVKILGVAQTLFKVGIFVLSMHYVCVLIVGYSDEGQRGTRAHYSTRNQSTAKGKCAIILQKNICLPASSRRTLTPVEGR